MTPYIYRPLNSSLRNFRTARLHPAANFSDPIHCDLIEAELGYGPKYEALSYVWGDPTQTVDIDVEGSVLKITVNLDLFLRYIREKYTTRTIWADAICIDQGNVEERSEQVQRMKDIYSLCERDLLWLGEADKETKAVIDELERMEKLEIQRSPQPSSRGGLWKNDKILRSTDVTSSVTSGSVSRLLGSRTIWERGWVMQELACSPTTTMVIGDQKMEWTVLSNILDHSGVPDAYHGPFTHGSYNEYVWDAFEKVQVIEHQRDIVHGVHQMNSTLLDVLSRFRKTYCTDPRDKIYSYLNLATNLREMGIVPDYKRSAKEVYIGVARAQIRLTGNLDVVTQSLWPLGHTSSDHPEVESMYSSQPATLVEGLPSWVPNFSCTVEKAIIFAQRNIFAAGKSNLPPTTSQTNPDVLTISGIVLGKIEVAKPIYGDANSWGKCMWTRDLLPSGLQDIDAPPQEYITGGDAFEAFWRTTIIDCLSKPNRRLSPSNLTKVGKLFVDWRKRITVLGRDLDERESFEDPEGKELARKLRAILKGSGLHNLVEKYQFAEIEGGLFGMVPFESLNDGWSGSSGSKIRDLVIVVEGGKVPIVIREIAGGGSWTLVGTASKTLLQPTACHQVQNGSCAGARLAWWYFTIASLILRYFPIAKATPTPGARTITSIQIPFLRHFRQSGVEGKYSIFHRLHQFAWLSSLLGTLKRKQLNVHAKVIEKQLQRISEVLLPPPEETHPTQVVVEAAFDWGEGDGSLQLIALRRGATCQPDLWPVNSEDIITAILEDPLLLHLVRDFCSKVGSESLTGIVFEDMLSPNGYTHYDSYDHLQAAARGGCKLCTLLLLAIEKNPGHRDLSSWVSFRATKLEATERPTLTLAACDGEGLKSDLVEVRLKSSYKCREEVLTVIGIYADKDSPAKYLIPGRRLLSDPTRWDAMSSLENWIKGILEADDHRNDCQQLAGEQTLPKRVLDVSQETGEVIKLIDSDNGPPFPGQYIALSHCWGQQEHFRLTTSTLTEMKTGISISQLAKNFQDAILITRLLGIRYLWIDALCILQDAKTDWELESAKMGQYYKSSWLTISAGMSSGGNEGLLAKRSTYGLSHIRLETRDSNTSWSRSSIYFALDPIRPSTQCPIRARGWTFQEELLSRRYLSFETTQTYLRCGSLLHHECGRQEDLLSVSSPFMEGEQLLKQKDWFEILVRYSSRSLTLASDKLPALSGLAHEYQLRWGDEYVAGMWKKDLWKSLLWRRNEKYNLPEPKRPVKYRAPTWSWASMDGRIEFDTFPNFREQDSRIQINDVSVELSGSDSMGQVSGGIIELRAVFVEMDPYGNIPNHFDIRLRKIYDVPNEVKPEIPTRDQWFLWVSKDAGLIVRRSLTGTGPLRHSSAYERVGYFSSQDGAGLDRFWKRVSWTGLYVSAADLIYPSYIFLI
ncbi:hypothetical protein G7Y89_g10626 [Cudoniella acicularis]|uniref:Heterokaryon incompatibility domain-containing protein n=1 Tax=Cudoniella acicularis TaxID=354080 RepID=A0A8H4REQ1_9HELO|nr:hypothetical protein G7Y89_g10626 [Cudoniella acicularis]